MNIQDDETENSFSISEIAVDKTISAEVYIRPSDAQGDNLCYTGSLKRGKIPDLEHVFGQH